MKIAIIGAGMSGLACADALLEVGHEVSLFDKGRGPGGRMSTRRIMTGLGEAAFDHGAQYFTARDSSFKPVVERWQQRGGVAPWPLAGPDAWVGVPGMSAVIKDMAAAHDVHWSCPVLGLLRSKDGWTVQSPKAVSEHFDAAVLAVPAEQAAPLLSLHDFGLARCAAMARSQPCWTGMFVFDQPLNDVPIIIRDRQHIAWAARNGAKPGRTGSETLVVQASAAWSQVHLERDQAEIAAKLWSIFSEVTSCGGVTPHLSTAHRWRFALSAGIGDGALWNAILGLRVCGDWLLGPRVECAWLSGRELAGRISNHSGIDLRSQPESLRSYPVAARSARQTSIA
jgi:predicted NAD/FAD-dependent oxidoreductase